MRAPRRLSESICSTKLTASECCAWFALPPVTDPPEMTSQWNSSNAHRLIDRFTRGQACAAGLKCDTQEPPIASSALRSASRVEVPLTRFSFNFRSSLGSHSGRLPARRWRAELEGSGMVDFSAFLWLKVNGETEYRRSSPARCRRGVSISMGKTCGSDRESILRAPIALMAYA
eukprot:scaffold123105_cov30-Tisochrysis_lutea.AAC.4